MNVYTCLCVRCVREKENFIDIGLEKEITSEMKREETKVVMWRNPKNRKKKNGSLPAIDHEEEIRSAVLARTRRLRVLVFSSSFLLSLWFSFYRWITEGLRSSKRTR